MFKPPVHQFEPGNSYGKGRPRGARNKLANSVFQDILQFWNDPTPDGKTTKGKAALLAMWRERPHEFVKVVATLMPREFLVESVVTELGDDELNNMISLLREQHQRAIQEAATPALTAPKGEARESIDVH
jgi:hypothetical protein